MDLSARPLGRSVDVAPIHALPPAPRDCESLSQPTSSRIGPGVLFLLESGLDVGAALKERWSSAPEANPARAAAHGLL